MTTLVQLSTYIAALGLVEFPSLQWVICILLQLVRIIAGLDPPLMLSPLISTLLAPVRLIGACADLDMQNTAGLAGT